jgi:hypothetical protein
VGQVFNQVFNLPALPRGDETLEACGEGAISAGKSS